MSEMQVLLFRVDNREYVALVSEIKAVNGKTIFLYANGVQARIVVDEIIEVINIGQVSDKITKKCNEISILCKQKEIYQILSKYAIIVMGGEEFE